MQPPYKPQRPAGASNWKGGRRVSAQGYILIYFPSHPRANNSGCVFEHVLIAEAALGRPLPRTARVHHFDENRANNAPSNLVICDSESYHKLLHRRQRASAICGNPNAIHCAGCDTWGDPSAINFRSGRRTYRHPECMPGRRVSATEFFCGHPKTPSNQYTYGRVARRVKCRTCMENRGDILPRSEALAS